MVDQVAPPAQPASRPVMVLPVPAPMGPLSRRRLRGGAGAGVKAVGVVVPGPVVVGVVGGGGPVARRGGGGRPSRRHRPAAGPSCYRLWQQWLPGRRLLLATPGTHHLLLEDLGQALEQAVGPAGQAGEGAVPLGLLVGRAPLAGLRGLVGLAVAGHGLGDLPQHLQRSPQHGGGQPPNYVRPCPPTRGLTPGGPAHSPGCE